MPPSLLEAVGRLTITIIVAPTTTSPRMTKTQNTIRDLTLLASTPRSPTRLNAAPAIPKPQRPPSLLDAAGNRTIVITIIVTVTNTPLLIPRMLIPRTTNTIKSIRRTDPALLIDAPTPPSSPDIPPRDPRVQRPLPLEHGRMSRRRTRAEQGRVSRRRTRARARTCT
ncbi:hypothetical protein Tdes44962_MAKER05751 [Teratosphaeria destructans]|uniref:Uncharacterized protein n=1 Tax=Teratosphaeria destructans TaxID=418781 RepID=A0A9W7VYN9_9PEZI|nr:hypothetical protein Tdes44962_MAKER05751 [Teratosphaeria destructans]